MSAKAFDIVLFGATGFTGRLVAKHIHAQNVDIKWAIAGRAQSKLSALMTELVNMQSPRNLPDILIADASDGKSLSDICGEAKIVLNCTGPFRFLGKEVVEACLKAKCTYMDICGEPQFMEKCFLDYHDKAVESDVLILHACAFDSVPADMGALYTMRQYEPTKCLSVESFLSIDSPKGLKGHFTTYESAVHGLGDLQVLKGIRERVKLKYNPPKINYVGKRIPKISTYKFESRVNKYVIPFMGSDASVVRSSQRALSIRTGQLTWPHYSACITINDFYTVAATSFYGSMFYTLSGNSWGRSLLLSYPELFSADVFSKTGPSKEQLESTSFKMHFFASGYSTDENENENNMDMEDFRNDEESEKIQKAKRTAALLPSEVAITSSSSKACSFGRIFKSKKEQPQDTESLRPDKAVHVIVSGPEPGYVATPAIFFALALCVLEERETMPKGGVLTPSAAFYDSPTVFNRLQNAGLLFQVQSTSNIEDKPHTRDIEEEEEGKQDIDVTAESVLVGEERILKNGLLEDSQENGVLIGTNTKNEKNE